MLESVQFRALAATLERLKPAGVVPAVADILEADAPRLAKELCRRIVEVVPAYTDSGNPDVMPELDAHLASHVDEICRLLRGNTLGDLAFVIEHAQQRAGQRFPLDAVHQAYRQIGKLVTEWIRDAALQSADKTAHVPRVLADVTDFMLEYMGAIATLLTSEYVGHTRLLAEAEGDRRTELLTTLLEGYDESDRRAAQLLRRAGYLEQRQSYCVAVARSIIPQEMESAARAQRMVDAIGEVLGKTPLRYISGVRDDLVVVVMSGARRVSGWTRPHTVLAERVYAHLRLVGPAALIGLSNDVPSTSHIPRAAAEAKFALGFGDVANRIVRYSQIPFRQLLVSRAREEILSALPAWLDTFVTADTKARGSLTATLQAYATADMNVLQSAKELGVHPNTIYARMQKIEDLTGQNALSYHALTEMLLAIECRQGT